MHRGIFCPGQKIVSGYNIFRTDVAAFPHTDHGRDFCNIGVFKAFHVFLIKAELTKNSLFSLKLCARQMFDVGSVYIFKKFGIIKPNRTRPTGNLEHLPVPTVLWDQISGCYSFFKKRMKRLTACAAYSGVKLVRRTQAGAIVDAGAFYFRCKKCGQRGAINIVDNIAQGKWAGFFPSADRPSYIPRRRERKHRRRL